MAFCIGAPTFTSIWLRIGNGMVQRHQSAVARKKSRTPAHPAGNSKSENERLLSRVGRRNGVRRPLQTGPSGIISSRHQVALGAVNSNGTAAASNDSATNQDEIAQHALMGGSVARYSIGPKSA